ncbi:unnamed protein product [Ilex paraguariensis]|uniref:Uncharacterized protein n=1 Tax=Ilex paraguariensis TaxID=185542 RepID=A0ABC8TR04_9AQUA
MDDYPQGFHGRGWEAFKRLLESAIRGDQYPWPGESENKGWVKVIQNHLVKVLKLKRWCCEASVVVPIGVEGLPFNLRQREAQIRVHKPSLGLLKTSFQVDFNGKSLPIRVTVLSNLGSFSCIEEIRLQVEGKIAETSKLYSLLESPLLGLGGLRGDWRRRMDEGFGALGHSEEILRANEQMKGRRMGMVHNGGKVNDLDSMQEDFETGFGSMDEERKQAFAIEAYHSDALNATMEWYGSDNAIGSSKGLLN